MTDRPLHRNPAPVSTPALAKLQFNGIDALAAGNVWASATLQTNCKKDYLVHLGNGRWSRVSLGSNALPAGITRVPGTAALWAAGMSGGKATIWGLGRVG